LPAIELSRLERALSTTSRERGREYARDGRVSLRSRRTPDRIEAKVIGTSRYDVVLRAEDGTLFAACSCPRFSREFELCKHIWATLVVCESSRIELAQRVDVLVPDDESDFVDDFDDRDEEPAWQPPARWRALVGAIGSPHVEPFDDLPEITWIIDAPMSGAHLALEIATRPAKKNGELGKPQVARIPSDAIAHAAPQDREILALITSNRYTYGFVEPRMMIGWPASDYVVAKLAATGRLWIRIAKGEYAENVRLDDGPPWQLALRAEEKNGDYVLSGTLHRGDERRPLSDALAVTPGGFVIFRDAIARFDDNGTQRWAMLLLRNGVTIPAREIADFAREVALAHAPVPIELPVSVAVQEQKGTLRAVLRLEHSDFTNRASADPSFEYDRTSVSPFVRSRAVFDRKVVILRDIADEKRKLDALWDAGFSRMGGSTVWIAGTRLREALPHLLAAGWEVSDERGTYTGGGALDVSLRSGIDWFDLEGGATFGAERVRLPRLLAAIRKGDSVVKLDDGRVGMIDPEWRSQLEPFLDVAPLEADGKVRFRRNQVLLLDALLASRPSIAFDEVFDQARRKLAEVRVAPRQPPESFRGELRPYQSEGLGWFSFLRELNFGGCLADDMGLGKTVQVLALLEERRLLPDRRPSLVVVPRSLIFNWKAEAARFTPEIRILDHSTPDRIRATDHFPDYDVILTTYALLRREVEIFADFEFDYVILDEAQAIKNASSQAAKAVALLRGGHRLALTGTPIENHLGELSSLFEFLNPGMLRAQSGRVMRMLRDAGKNTPEAAETRATLARSVRPFILRRTKSEVAPELPDRVEQTIFCELEPKQRKLYDELRDYYRAAVMGHIAEKGIARSKIHILEALLRMRQAACHPGLVNEKMRGDSSAKLDALFEELPVLIDEGHKVLLFSQFTSLLSIVREMVESRGLKYAYIDGKTKDREMQVARFQKDADIPLFLISLKAGGLGLNLTAAEYVYLLDPWWNPAVEAQAIDRAHRIGQSRTVFAYRLVAKDTIEEKILQLQQSKRALADAIIGEENSILRQLTADDLNLLLS
jgi:superfamily II DNA or RNA helicase